MPWDKEDENKSTWTPLTPDQQDELRRRHQEPALQEITPTYNDRSRKPEMPHKQRERPTTPPPAQKPTLH